MFTLGMPGFLSVACLIHWFLKSKKGAPSTANTSSNSFESAAVPARVGAKSVQVNTIMQIQYTTESHQDYCTTSQDKSVDERAVTVQDCPDLPDLRLQIRKDAATSARLLDAGSHVVENKDQSEEHVIYIIIKSNLYYKS